MSAQERQVAEEAYWQAHARGSDMHRPGFVRGKWGRITTALLIMMGGIYCIYAPFDGASHPDQIGCLIPMGIFCIIVGLGNLLDARNNWDQGL